MPKPFRFGTIAPDPLDFAALKRKATNDPVGLLGQCRKHHNLIKKGKRRSDWELWVTCYAAADGIRKHPGRFVELRQSKLFEQRTYKIDIEDVLRLALLIGTDADTRGPTYKSACNIAGKLKPFFDQNVEPERVLAAIVEKRGLKRLHDDHDTSDQGQGQVHAEPNGDDADHDGRTRSSAPSTGKSKSKLTCPLHPPARPGSPPSPSQKQKPSEDGRGLPDSLSDLLDCGCDALELPETEPDEFILEVVVTRTQLRRVLNSPINGHTRLIVKHPRSNPNWERIVATSVKLLN